MQTGVDSYNAMYTIKSNMANKYIIYSVHIMFFKIKNKYYFDLINK